MKGENAIAEVQEWMRYVAWVKWMYRDSSRTQASVTTRTTPEKRCRERISISLVKLKGKVLFFLLNFLLLVFLPYFL